MKLNRASHTRLLDDLTVTIDPTGSDVELGIRQVDGTVTWYPAAWLDTPVKILDDPDTWFQTAQTTDYFAGPDAELTGSPVVLTTGRHLTQTRVSKGQDVIVGASSPIDVT